MLFLLKSELLTLYQKFLPLLSNSLFLELNSKPADAFPVEKRVAYIIPEILFDANFFVNKQGNVTGVLQNVYITMIKNATDKLFTAKYPRKMSYAQSYPHYPQFWLYRAVNC